jgi:catechol 2,3-dioxygenase-like lactoylglutathione lyase family enzyme
MIDHIGFSVSDVAKSKNFYTEALNPLGYSVIMDFGDKAVGFGRDGKPDFWIGKGEAIGKFHIALASPDRPTVDAFHAAALKAGGKDNGKPGLRPEYHPNYYAAFVLDPNGNNIEAVCHH